MKLLLVEDNAQVRAEIASYLSQFPIQIDEAENGLTAFNKAKSDKYDIVITDYKMPYIDGLKLIDNLENSLDYQAEQILLLTTDNSHEFKNKAKSLAINWLAKPVNRKSIEDFINQTLVVDAA
ncbi:response regulator [Catenovulum maritimum]|uniref:Response regulatory domain-containing protein n=1 Tax=Catenovulum maritimum TaxID=1513271 RepID=A0A0J8GSX1_9ALTE|nr:response regulator [Catenovulum maritimum]KMT65890.1 hypothetical protein XM47_06765 [Catenovulum maritimum]